MTNEIQTAFNNGFAIGLTMKGYIKVGEATPTPPEQDVPAVFLYKNWSSYIKRRFREYDNYCFLTSDISYRNPDNYKDMYTILFSNFTFWYGGFNETWKENGVEYSFPRTTVMGSDGRYKEYCVNAFAFGENVNYWNGDLYTVSGNTVVTKQIHYCKSIRNSDGYLPYPEFPYKLTVDNLIKYNSDFFSFEDNQLVSVLFDIKPGTFYRLSNVVCNKDMGVLYEKYKFVLELYNDNGVLLETKGGYYTAHYDSGFQTPLSCTKCKIKIYIYGGTITLDVLEEKPIELYEMD